MSEQQSEDQKLIAELRSWVGWPKKDLDLLLESAADRIELLGNNLRATLDELHHHMGCDPECEKRHG